MELAASYLPFIEENMAEIPLDDSEKAIFYLLVKLKTLKSGHPVLKLSLPELSPRSK